LILILHIRDTHNIFFYNVVYVLVSIWGIRGVKFSSGKRLFFSAVIDTDVLNFLSLAVSWSVYFVWLEVFLISPIHGIVLKFKLWELSGFLIFQSAKYVEGVCEVLVGSHSLDSTPLLRLCRSECI